MADVIFGDASPSGKLPVTVPRRTADLPPFIDYAMKGRTYRFTEVEPLYPFGFGLGYAQLTYGPLIANTAKLAAGQELKLRATLTNSSDCAAFETVQCYLQPPRSWPLAPHATLVDFKKVSVPAQGSVAVEFRLPAAAFAQVDAAGQHVHVPGSYGLVVGSASPGARAIALGAPAPASSSVTLV
ncbi:MAG: glycoside hydrolase family 3 C-terminal domain-containing protein [Lacunisphaera sp.]